MMLAPPAVVLPADDLPTLPQRCGVANRARIQPAVHLPLAAAKAKTIAIAVMIQTMAGPEGESVTVEAISPSA